MQVARAKRFITTSPERRHQILTILWWQLQALDDVMEVDEVQQMLHEIETETDLEDD